MKREQLVCDICGKLMYGPQRPLSGSTMVTTTSGSTVSVSYRADAYLYDGIGAVDICPDCAHDIFDSLLGHYPRY